MNAHRLKTAGWLAAAAMALAGCATISAKPPVRTQAKGPQGDAVLAARRPGEVTSATVEPLRRMASEYNTVAWSYPLALDIDRDLARAGAAVSGPAVQIDAEIGTVYDYIALGRLAEGRASLDEAEAAIAAARANLSAVDQRMLEVNLLIARSSLAAHRSLAESAPGRDADLAESAEDAARAIALASDPLSRQTDTGAAAHAEDGAIVLETAGAAAYNASHHRGVVGDIVAAPMSEEVKRLVLKIRAQFAETYALMNAGKTAEARQVNEAANATVRELPGGVADWLRAEVLCQSAMLDLRGGDAAKAQQSVQTAIAIVQKDAGNSRLEAFLSRTLADIALARHDTALAKTAQARSFEILVDQADGLPPRREEVTGYLDLLAPGAVAGDEAEVKRFFEVSSLAIETETAKTVADVAGVFASSDSTSGAAIRRLLAARRQGTQAEARLARVRDPEAQATPEDIKSAETEVLAARREIADATAAMVATGDPRAAVVLSPRTTVQAVQAVLRPKEAYVRYIFLDDGRGYAVLIRKDRAKVAALDLTEAQAAEQVNELRGFTTIVDRDRFLPRYPLREAYATYQALFGGFDSDLRDVDTLTIEPAGSLFSLPFAALLTAPPEADLMARSLGSQGVDNRNAPWLARDKAVELSVGAAAFVRLRSVAKPSAAPKPILAFANPTPRSDQEAGDQLAADQVTRGLALAGGEARSAEVCTSEAQAITHFRALPDTEAEAQAAAQALGGAPTDVVSALAFTDQAVRERKDLSQYRLLLFATHAALPKATNCWPEPFLITSKGEGALSHGLLDTKDIASLILDADLVVLSACDTAASDTSGQALGGLAQSFFYAGSRGVVVSHWSASSRGSKVLMGHMYEELGRGATPSAALATAERALMDDPKYSHPYYWALFTTVGGASVKLQ